MVKRLLKVIKKQTFLTWIVVVSITFSTLMAYATYDEASSVMKRVIVASEGKIADFTSNYLTKDDTGIYSHKTLYRSESGNSYYETELVIRNHDPNAQDYPYEQDINYSIVAMITDSSGTAITDFSRFFTGENAYGTKTIAIKDSDGTTLASFSLSSSTSGTQTSTISNQKIEFVKGRPGQLKYKLEFTNWSLDDDTDLCIKLVTVLDRGIGNIWYPDLQDIGCILGLGKNLEDAQNGWRASINEIEQSINDALGYNLILTGSGRAEITIMWDTDKISVNKLFRGTEAVFDLTSGEVTFTDAPSKSDSNSTDTWATLVVHADANLDRSGNAELGQYRNYYDIQIYGVGSQALSGDFFEVLENGASRSNSSLITVSITEPTAVNP